MGALSIPVTLLAIIGLTNAINMIDGCDGLASNLVLVSLLVLLIFGNAVFEESIMLLLLVVSSSLISFLPFNFSNNTKFKTFLGDGGSLFLGFLVSALLVQFAEVNLTYDPSIVLWFAAVPILIYVLSLPHDS